MLSNTPEAISANKQLKSCTPLARFLLEKFASPSMILPEMTAELKIALLNHAWPGNVRELENFMRKYAVFQDPASAAEELRLKSRARTEPRAATIQFPAETGASSVAASSLERVTQAQQKAEKGVILDALNRAKWNRKQAARVLGVDYKALLYKMKKHDISRDFEDESASYIASDSTRLSVVSAAN